MSEKLKEAIQKEAEKHKERTEKLAAAIATARTRTGKPKVTKEEPKPEPEPVEEVVDKPARIEAFIEHEKGLLAAVDIPDDTGDIMFNAIDAVLYHKERISKAELAKKHFEEA